MSAGEITADTVRRLLRYEPETGKLFWLTRPREFFKCDPDHRSWNTRYSGIEAFTANADGYRCGRIFGRLLKAHRVIWLLQTGAWPTGEVDHIDGATSNNRWVNLRDVSCSENQRNTRMRQNNTSGVNGVRWDKRERKWLARLCVDGREMYLGHFATIEAATAARSIANREYGFSDRHGSSS